MPVQRRRTLPDEIVLEGVRVHNLKGIDVRIPLHGTTVVTGVSGSGKSSLAFDTLYAEGQRRYIESFSPYARQFLERLDRPDADRIDNLPPAVALRQNSVAPGKRSNVATATELYDYLRLLFAKAGRIIDPASGREVRRDTPERVAAGIDGLPEGRRLLIAFPASALQTHSEPGRPSGADRLIDAILERGFTRLITGGTLVSVGRDERPSVDDQALVVADRHVTGRQTRERIVESLEAAFASGGGRCVLLLEGDDGEDSIGIDDSTWSRQTLDHRLVSPVTGREFLEPIPALFSFHSPIGACPVCRGFGSVSTLSWERLVPDPSKTLREGAIVAWTTPAYRHEWEELLNLAGDFEIPLDVPFGQFEPRHLALLREGIPSRRFGGLNGFFRWLERKRYKIGVAAFLARFRSYENCPECAGARLNPDALAIRIGGRHIAEICRDSVADAIRWFEDLPAEALGSDPAVSRSLLPEIRGRLETLSRLGLGYLTLDRLTATLSGGEARRVALSAAIGADLVNMLYVLDEPSTGLHPRDRARVVATLAALRDAGNTVVVVEHDPAFLDAADWAIDLGPGAGRDGGRVLYAGPPVGLAAAEGSTTARWMAGGKTRPRECAAISSPERSGAIRLGGDASPRGTLVLSPCSRHNLKNLTVEFPLGALCVVSGVSGSGKSTLVTETLYPALCRSLKKPCAVEEGDRIAEVAGAAELDDAILIDQSPIGRTSRSNPATYLGIFDHIRTAFAAVPESRLRNFTPGTFSFNTDRGGRCPHCRGAGVVTVDMQFLPDIEVSCPECHCRRFRRDVLEIKLRGRSIADVLDMTAAEAFAFFRGMPQVQRRLATLKEVGLDYLPLGQPATTLSGGESQRLKIASSLGGGTGKRTIFLFDEPTVGLHAADVARLIGCFRRLISVGHSIVLIEHRLQVIREADWIIDLGPEAGDEGGRIIGAGPPAALVATTGSTTGRYL